MGNVVSFGGGARPLPALDGELGYAVGRITDPRPELPPLDCGRQAAAAAAALPAFEQACQPMPAMEDARVIGAWLLPVRHAVRNPPDEPEFKRRVVALAALCADMPAWAFSPQAQVEAMRFDWWPSAVELEKLVRPAFAEAKAKRDALRKIVEAGRAIPQAPERTAAEMTQAERDALADKFRQAMREVKRQAAAEGEAPEREVVTPAYLPSAALRERRKALAAGYAKAGLHEAARKVLAALGEGE